MNTNKVKLPRRELLSNSSTSLWVARRNSTTDGSASPKRPDSSMSANSSQAFSLLSTSLSDQSATSLSETTRTMPSKKRLSFNSSRTSLPMLVTASRDGETLTPSRNSEKE